MTRHWSCSHGNITKGRAQLDVYSRNTSSWKIIEDSWDCRPTGEIYYVSWKLRRKKWEIFLIMGKIASLDLTNEIYGEVEQPKNERYWLQEDVFLCFVTIHIFGL